MANRAPLRLRVAIPTRYNSARRMDLGGTKSSPTAEGLVLYVRPPVNHSGLFTGIAVCVINKHVCTNAVSDIHSTPYQRAITIYKHASFYFLVLTNIFPPLHTHKFTKLRKRQKVALLGCPFLHFYLLLH